MDCRKSRSAVAYVLLGLAMAWSQPAIDCRAADNTPAANSPAASAPAAKEKAKAKGRMPNYYSKVVDGQQREKIYQIQKTYGPQIQQLQAQLKALNDKRDAEIDALLTPEQRVIVAALMTEAKQKRAVAAAMAEEKQKRAAAAAKPAPAGAKPAANSTTTTEAVPSK
jgi:hypothetical protein